MTNIQYPTGENQSPENAETNIQQGQKSELPIILIVDDEASNLSLLRNTLIEARCRLRMATNGRDALRSIYVELPDLILVDITMPEMDGFEFCEHLKRNEATHDIPIIFLSAHDELAYKVKAFKVGGVDYIVKPFQAEEVLARVTTHLEMSRLMRQLEQEVNERQRTQVALQAEVQRRKLSEASEKQQRLLAEALLDTAIVLTSTLDVDEVIDRILANVDTVIDFDTCSVFLLNGSLKPVAQRGYTKSEFKRIQEIAVSISANDTDFLFLSEAPHVVTSNKDAEPDLLYNKLSNSKSTMGAPIVVNNEIIGILLLGRRQIRSFQDNDIRVMEIFAQQVGVAIENAKHHSQLRQLTILEERNRIARDLHDTISQNLWSMKIVADTLPQLWNKKTKEFWENLDHLGIVAQTTLAEMRSLLLELQPQFLDETPLCKLIDNLTKSVASKLGINIHFECDIFTDIPNNIKIVFYRVAQEALNNIMRHANPQFVKIQLLETKELIELTIYDDGGGFDLQDIPPGHIGIKTMMQRSERIGANFIIHSSKHDGTEIKLRWEHSKEDDF